jgi:hypothetical protein
MFGVEAALAESVMPSCFWRLAKQDALPFRIADQELEPRPFFLAAFSGDAPASSLSTGSAYAHAVSGPPAGCSLRSFSHFAGGAVNPKLRRRACRTNSRSVSPPLRILHGQPKRW